MGKTLFIACLLNITAGLTCLSAALANVLLYHPTLRVLGIAFVLCTAGATLVGLATVEEGFPLAIKQPLSVPLPLQRPLPSIYEFVIRSLIYIAFALISCDTTAVPQDRSILSKWAKQEARGLEVWVYANAIVLVLIAFMYFGLGLTEVHREQHKTVQQHAQDCLTNDDWYYRPDASANRLDEQKKRSLKPFSTIRGAPFRTKQAISPLWQRRDNKASFKSSMVPFERHRHDSTSSSSSMDRKPLALHGIPFATSPRSFQPVQKSPLGSVPVTPSTAVPRYMTFSSLRNQAMSPTKGLQRSSGNNPYICPRKEMSPAYGSMMSPVKPLHHIEVDVAPDSLDGSSDQDYLIKIKGPSCQESSGSCDITSIKPDRHIYVPSMGENVEMTTSNESSTCDTRSQSPQPHFKTNRVPLFSDLPKTSSQNERGSGITPPRGRSRWIKYCNSASAQQAHAIPGTHSNYHDRAAHSGTASNRSSLTLYDERQSVMRRDDDGKGSNYSCGSSHTYYMGPRNIPTSPRSACNFPGRDGAACP